MKLFGTGQSGGAHANKPVRHALSFFTRSTPAGKNKLRKWVYIAAAVVLVLLIGMIVYAIWERPPELSAPAQSVTAPGSEQSPAVQKHGDPSADPVGTDVPEEPVLPGEAPLVEMDGDRRDGIYTCLLVGRDFASNSTDTIIVGAFDTKKHTISCVSIPRDTLINIKWAGTPKKLNAVYPGFINSGEDGMAALRNQVKNLLGFDVDCYALVTLDAVVQAVDAIGGIWFDVPQDMNYYDPTQDLRIDISKGYQLLDGENALKLCRFRNGYANGDLQRINVQQSFLKAAASQMLSLGNIPNLGTLVDILVANLDTNLTAANMAWFARQFLSCDMEDISFETLPYSSEPVINGVSFVSIDVSAWLDVVNERLNPYIAPVTQNHVNILTSNASGSVMNSTTGVIAGGEGSFYCLTCTVNNDGKAVYHAPGACPSTEPTVTEPPEVTPVPTESPVPTAPPEAPETEPPQPEETPEIEVVIIPPDLDPPGM